VTAYLITGSDASLGSRALTDLVTELTGGPGAMVEVEAHEPSEASEEGEAKGRHDASAILTALATPPWLSEHRIVVVREAGLLTADQAAEIAKLVVAPPVPNVLVLVAVGKAVPTSLSKAVRSSDGRVIETDPGPNARARSDWFDAKLQRSRVHLDAGARHLLAEHVGEDAAAVDPILDLLAATYGEGARVGEQELRPLLGEEGGTPPWALTDAIDRGDLEEAVRTLRRMLGGGGRHPLQVLAILHRHVSGLLRLDGADDVRSADDAAAVLKMSPFPARKLLEQSRRLGHERIVRALDVVAGADADLRGRLSWPAELVMEVAVARLAQLSSPRGATTSHQAHHRRPTGHGGGAR
jgi:DNA polymerase-3 subunit delta